MVRTLPSLRSTRLVVAATVLAVLVGALLLGPAAPPAPAQPAPSAGVPSGRPYVPPVAGATVVDHFRAPSSPYGPGNRGLDEVTVPGSVVVASAGGQVIFAGEVAGALHVTLLHADGLRSSYSYLAAIGVRVGDTLPQGAPLGLSGPLFHFGVRDRTGTYLDPEALFATAGRARLVAGPDEGGAPLDDPPGRVAAVERAALSAVVATTTQAGSRAAARARALAHEALAVTVPVSLAHLAAEVDRWHDQQQRCTPAAAPTPRPPGRRIAVLVGGLGSTSERAAVDHVDVAALGYAPTDVVRFSYRGGVVPGRVPEGSQAGLDHSTYGSDDTEVDLHQSADRLGALLDQLAAAAPGVPIDVIAHSQGGLVVRLALARGARPPELGTVVTLGTPHHGADLATAVAALDPRSAPGRALGSAGGAVGLDLDLTRPSVEQLGETSSVIAELDRPLPPGVHLLSVGASGDLTVPDVHTVVAGADHATVHLTGPHAHDRLPGEPATTREIALAIAGAPPTCAALTVGLTDVVVSHVIAQSEDALGLTLAAGTRVGP